MVFYLKGKISHVFSEKIIIDVNNVGYDMYVSHPSNYRLGETHKLYTYLHIHDNERYLVGFDNLDEKKMFLLLISVNGLGPKIAVGMLRNATSEEIYNAIVSNNISFLKKLPNIGSKGAEQIILDLKGRRTGKKVNPNLNTEAELALKELGFKKKKIDEVLASINEQNLTTEEIVKIALTKLS